MKKLLSLIALMTFCLTGSMSIAASGQNRIIVIGASTAEIIVALGCADQVVLRGGGTDHIPDIAHAVRVGGYRPTSAEGLLSVEPTIALMPIRRTKPIVKKHLEAAGVPVHLFDQLKDLHAIPERINAIADLLNCQSGKAAVIQQYQDNVDAALAYAGAATSKPRGLFLLSGGGRPTVVAGGDTHIAALIRYAGAVNVSDSFSSFKPMSQEAMLVAAPDFILVNKEGLIAVNGVQTALEAPGVGLTPAGQNDAVFSLPSHYLTDFGLSTPEAIKILAGKIHPDLPKQGQAN